MYLKEYKDEIIKDYLENKLSQREIAKKYNTYQATIQKFLKRNNIKARENTVANRKYYLDINYFDEIDTPNKAYILGFLYADGCNNKKYRTIKLSLQDTDVEMLEDIRKEMKIERPLSTYRKRHKNEKHKDAKELCIQNAHMCEVLEKYGCVPKKSLILQFPDWLREDLFSHFIRGYFDGDGHIGRLGRGAHCNFTSSYDFCTGLSKYFSIHIPEAKQKVSHGANNQATGILTSTDKASVKLIMDYIYQDCDEKTLFLKRKHNVYLSKFYPELLSQD